MRRVVVVSSFVVAASLFVGLSRPSYGLDQKDQKNQNQKRIIAAEIKDPKTKRTTVDFEDQLVQGEVKKPELFYLLQKKQFNFGKLIKLRENFIPEMTKTAEDIEKAK